MFNLFKKKEPVRIYNLHTFLDERSAERDVPKKLSKVFWANRWSQVNNYMLSHNYLRLNPNRFKDENIWYFKKWKIELDVEKADCGLWISSGKFKEFSEKENLWLEFFFLFW